MKDVYEQNLPKTTQMIESIDLILQNQTISTDEKEQQIAHEINQTIDFFMSKLNKEATHVIKQIFDYPFNTYSVSVAKLLIKIEDKNTNSMENISCKSIINKHFDLIGKRITDYLKPRFLRLN